MDYLGITKYLTSPRPKKPWWELDFGDWPDTAPEPEAEEPDGELDNFLGPRAAPSVVPPPDQPAPPRGLLDRVADRMGDLGYGGGEDAKRAALQRALGAFGARLSAGAMKEGLGGIGSAVSEGFGAYEGGLLEQRKRRDEEDALHRQAEGDEVQRGYMKAITSQMEGKPAAEAASLRQAIEARKAKVEERRAWLGQQAPDVQKRLGALIGADEDQWNRYVYESGAPPEEEKPDRVSLSEGEDVYERQPDGTMKRVLSRPPRPRESGGDRAPRAFSLSPGEQRYEEQPDGTYKLVVERPKTAAGSKPFDQRAEATRIYTDALKDKSHSAYRSAPGPGGQDVPDVKATWKAAFEAAGAAAPPPPPRVNSTNDAANDSPMANHARNKAVAALRRGAPEAAVLAELKKMGALNGWTPEQILANAKRIAGGR